VRYYGEWMRQRAWERIGHLYPTVRLPQEQGGGEATVIAWLWARTVTCPNPACRAEMPLISTFELSKKQGRRAWVEPIVDRSHQPPTVDFRVRTGAGRPPDPPKVGRGAKFKCVACSQIAPDQHIKDQGMAHKMDAQLMAIVAEGDHGRIYLSPSSEQQALAKSAEPSWAPNEPLAYEPRAIWCSLYGLATFGDLFTDRQLVALTTFSDLVAEAREQAQRDALAAGLADDDTPLRDGGRGALAYAEAASVYLAFAVDRSSDFWGSLAFWANQPKNEIVAHVFGRQALPMVWDFAEANPFSSSGGNWTKNLDFVAKALDFGLPGQVEGKAFQADAAQLNSSVPLLVSTDPPYYDNIGYADLADYFYVWLRRSLKNTYPYEFATMLVPKDSELVAAPYRFDGDRSEANMHFEGGLFRSFALMRDLTDPKYPLTVYYAFKQAESADSDGGEIVSSTGWETMLQSLLAAGFVIDGTWPIRTERTIGLKGSTNMLASSVVLVCRPRSQDAPVMSRREFVNQLRNELPPALQNMQSGSIAPVDLAQASIGPGMAVYSRYRQVLEPNGEPLMVRAALQIINQELDAYLAEQEGDLDRDTRFAITWFEQYGFDSGEFGVADVLARAKDTSVDGVAQAGLVVAGRGKVRLRSWLDTDWEMDWNPQGDRRATVWEATHHLIKRLQTGGESGAARLLARMTSDLAAEARQLAYRLYSICERKNWAEYALEYNKLVVSWPQVQEQATQIREQLAAGGPTEQASLFE